MGRYFSSSHRSHKLARLKVDDEVGHVKSGDLTRIRGQNGPDDDYLAAAAAWHSTVYGATKREKSTSTQLNLSLVQKKIDLRFHKPQAHTAEQLAIPIVIYCNNIIIIS